MLYKIAFNKVSLSLSFLKLLHFKILRYEGKGCYFSFFLVAKFSAICTKIDYEKEKNDAENLLKIIKKNLKQVKNMTIYKF